MKDSTNLAESLLTLTGKIGEKPGAMQNDIAKFKAGFKIIDFAISKSNVPIIGQWWDGYIKPCTEQTLYQDLTPVALTPSLLL